MRTFKEITSQIIGCAIEGHRNLGLQLCALSTLAVKNVNI